MQSERTMRDVELCRIKIEALLMEYHCEIESMLNDDGTLDWAYVVDLDTGEREAFIN